MSNSTHKGKMVTRLDVEIRLCMESLPCQHYVTIHYADGTTEESTFDGCYIMKHFDHLVPDPYSRKHLSKNFNYMGVGCSCPQCYTRPRKV